MTEAMSFLQKAILLSYDPRPSGRAFYMEHKSHLSYGAANAIRTRDLVLTKDVLCLLSHSSKMAT